MQKSDFLLLKKFKNTESAQLCIIKIKILRRFRLQPNTLREKVRSDLKRLQLSVLKLWSFRAFRKQETN